MDFIYFWAVSAVDRLLSPAGAAGRSGVLLLARRKNFHPSPHHHREFTHQQGNKQMAAVIVHDSLPSPVVRYHHHDPSRPPHWRHVTITTRLDKRQVTADDDGTQAAVETPEARPSLRLAWSEDSQPASKPQQRLVRLWLVPIPASSQPIFSLPLWGTKTEPPVAAWMPPPLSHFPPFPSGNKGSECERA